MEKTLFIISSKAGNTEFNFSKDDIYRVYKRNGLKDSIEIIETSYKNHAVDLSKNFARDEKGKKSIIISGGDGTLNEAANAIYPTDTSLGLIPTGTGNDFSKNFSYKNFTIERTLKRRISPIDLIKLNGKICVNVTSLGFDTEVLSNAYDFLDKDPSLGKKAYIKSVLYSLKNIDYEKLDISLKDTNGENIKINGDYLLLALCNGGYYGSGFNPAPQAKVDDGILNLILVDDVSLLKLIPNIRKYKTGRHENSPYITSFNVKEGLIKSPKSFMANIDGEIFKTNRIDFKILEKSLNWIYFE